MYDKDFATCYASFWKQDILAPMVCQGLKYGSCVNVNNGNCVMWPWLRGKTSLLLFEQQIFTRFIKCKMFFLKVWNSGGGG